MKVSQKLKTFHEIELIEPIQRALAEENYVVPTPIQAKTIPAAIAGQDILGCAQTGTGKTAAFALPILNRLGERHRKAEPNRPHVLVLAPTRELAIQIGESFATYGRHLRLRHVLVYGGVNQANQVRALNRGAHVLVATPGRLIDLMDQGFVELGHLEVFVLDEADRMLDMGFMPALKRIISELPAKRQSLFFSATMPPNIQELSQRLLTNPIRVNVTPKSTSVERIEQQLMLVERATKLSVIRQVLSSASVDRAIVFTKTKRGANMLAEKLAKGGIRATAIHGNKSQSARQKALEAFRRKDVNVLVATDVAARGIDIDGVTHVINYDMPVEPESYVHRIGRTGRAGAAGIAISFCTPAERAELKAIEDLIGKRIPHATNQPVPQIEESLRRERDDSTRFRTPTRSQGNSQSKSKPASRSNSRTKPSSAPRKWSKQPSSPGLHADSPPVLSAGHTTRRGSSADRGNSENNETSRMAVLSSTEKTSAVSVGRKTLPKKHRTKSGRG